MDIGLAPETNCQAIRDWQDGAGRCGCAGSDWDRCDRAEDEGALIALIKGARSKFLDSGKLRRTQTILGSRGRHCYTLDR